MPKIISNKNKYINTLTHARAHGLLRASWVLFPILVRNLLLSKSGLI